MTAFRFPVGRKVGALAASTAILAVTLATVLAQNAAEGLAREALARRARTLAATVGAAYVGPILAGREVDIGLESLLDVILEREDDLVRAVVRDAEGGVIAEVGTDRPGTPLVLVEPILLPGQTGDVALGTVEATFTTSALEARVAELRRRFAAIGLAVAAAAIIAAALVGGTVTRPIRALEAAARRLRAGDLETRAEVQSNDEVRDLAETFNEMAAEIEKDRRLLADDLRRIRAVQELSRELSAELTRERLHVIIARAFQHLSTATKVSLWELDEKTGTLSIVAGINIDDRARQIRFRLGEGIVGRVLETGRPLRLDDARSDPSWFGERRDKKETLLAFPLIVERPDGRNRRFGVICLNDKADGTPFDERDEAALQTLAGSAAVALENARLYGEAITDGLTGLFVHRYFQQRMDEEIARARRYGHRLSLLMIDIDRFKHTNDTYGHQAGDRILVDISRILQRTRREADIPCRYGGEELGVILPDTDEAGARAVAERLRAAIEAFEFQGPQGPLRITVSIGASTWREGMVKDEVIHEADKALYAAKAAGRNRARHFLDIPKAPVPPEGEDRRRAA